MANTLTEVTPQLLAQGLLALREQAIMPQLVNRQYEAQAGPEGSSIDVPIPSAIAAVAVTPANTPPSTADTAPTSVSIVLDQWFEAPFYMTDKDMLEARAGILPMQASEAIKSLANNVDSFLLGKCTKFFGYVGTAGTTPFGSGVEIASATESRVVLNRQLAPLGDRRVVLDPDAEGAALALRAFHDMSFSGSNQGLIEGDLNRKLGFQWFMDQNVTTHTAGSITTGLIAKASTAQVVGDKTIICTTAASTGQMDFFAGDIITFAGDSQTYVVTAAIAESTAATDVTVAIEPGLVIALAGSEAVAIKATHVLNPIFHRDAIAFATRPLQASSHPGSIIQSAVDPISGLALRLEVTREHKRDRWSFDLLYGAEVVRRELGARLAG